jgi:hypothetical protein
MNRNKFHERESVPFIPVLVAKALAPGLDTVASAVNTVASGEHIGVPACMCSCQQVATPLSLRSRVGGTSS